MTEVVAELSGNHGGEIDNAFRLISAAKTAGADSVKFQCFNPWRLAQKRRGITWEGKTQTVEELLALYKQTYTPWTWFPELVAFCGTDIKWFSSVFDPEDVSFMEKLHCPRYKISAYEQLDGDLIKAVVATGKPIIMSVRPRPGLTILRAMDYDGTLPALGLSNHCSNLSWSVVGSHGPMVECHICLPDVATPDSGFSLNPSQFKAFVDAVKVARDA